MKKTSRFAVSVIAIVAMLVFAAPSFASVVSIDFAGNSAYTNTKVAQSGSVLQGYYLPISTVAVTSDTGGVLKNFGVSSYFNFSLNSATKAGTLDVYDLATSTKWLSADVTFQTLVGGTAKSPFTSIMIDSGIVTVDKELANLLASHGLSVPSNLQLGFATTSFNVKTNGVVWASSSDIQVVPEPLTAAMFFPGIALFGFARRRFLA